VLQSGTWTITRTLRKLVPFVLLIPTCPLWTPFSFYLWPRPELRAHRLRVLILSGNPEFRARDERSFVIFFVHVDTYISDNFRTASIELHFGAKRHLPLIPWRCENNSLRRVYMFACVPLYLKISFSVRIWNRSFLTCLSYFQDDPRIMKVGDKKRWIHDPNSKCNTYCRKYLHEFITLRCMKKV